MNGSSVFTLCGRNRSCDTTRRLGRRQRRIHLRAHQSLDDQHRARGDRRQRKIHALLVWDEKPTGDGSGGTSISGATRTSAAIEIINPHDPMTSSFPKTSLPLKAGSAQTFAPRRRRYPRRDHAGSASRKSKSSFRQNSVAVTTSCSPLLRLHRGDQHRRDHRHLPRTRFAGE